MNKFRNFKRESKKDDQKNTEKAFQLIRKVMLENKEIESTLWAGAVWSTLINGYIDSGISYDEFCLEVNCVKEFYKHHWDK